MSGMDDEMRGNEGTGMGLEHTVEQCCPVVELRQYTLKAGRRDELIGLFEEYFIEGQEQYGLRIIGQFRNRQDADQFVWLRGFGDMEVRRQALEGFYYGPNWKAHSTAANNTMIDSDNVLLLKPASEGGSFRLELAGRPALGVAEAEGGIIVATIYYFEAGVDKRFVDFFEKDMAPVLREAGATLQGYFVTEPGENTFPALPVREGEHVFVWFASFANEQAYTAYREALGSDQAWNAEIAPRLKGWLTKPEEVLELIPTRRSLLRHRPIR